MTANTTLADIAWFQNLRPEDRAIVRRLAVSVAEEVADQIEEGAGIVPIVVEESIDYDEALERAGIA